MSREMFSGPKSSWSRYEKALARSCSKHNAPPGSRCYVVAGAPMVCPDRLGLEKAITAGGRGGPSRLMLRLPTVGEAQGRLDNARRHFGAAEIRRAEHTLAVVRAMEEES